MSDAIKAQMINGMSQLNDALSDVFLPDGRKCFLLKREGQTQRFAVVQELTASYYVKWNSYREQMLFRVATIDAGFSDIVAQTHAIGYGVPNIDGMIDVYAISPDQRDRVPPDGSNPFWKLYGIRKPEQRFTIV